MIRPIDEFLSSWLVYSIELQQPLPRGNDYFLPIVVIVSDARGIPLAPPEIVDELKQEQVEQILCKLFDEQGTPNQIIIATNPSWDNRAWKAFGKEYKLELRMSQIQANTIVESTANSIQGIDAPDEQVASGLLRTALRLRSQKRRMVYLKKCLELEPDYAEAHIELADIEFQNGHWKKALDAYHEIADHEKQRWAHESPKIWWENGATRPYLRALYGAGMALWHQGKHTEAVHEFSQLLLINPTDHQGARFVIPLLCLLADQLENATAFFLGYEEQYSDDLEEPSFLFGWGLAAHLSGDEGTARKKYAIAMLRNIYIAPQLIEQEEPTRQMWQPNDRCEPGYADEFVDSFAVLWTRESGALRLVREVYEELLPQLQQLIAHRELMLDFLDQRYDPDYKAKWQQFVAEDDRLSKA